MDRLIKLICTFLVVISPLLSLENQNEEFSESSEFSEYSEEECRSALWNYSEAYTRITFGEILGVDDSFATVGSWLFNESENSLYYLDARYHHISNGGNAASIGTGIRFGDTFKGCGAHIYYDWRYSKSTNISQVEAGIEAWLCSWEYHLNAYLPFQSIEKYAQKICTYEGGFIFRQDKTLYPCSLVSLQIGKRYDIETCLFPNLSIKGLIGPYWISNKIERNQYGVMASLDFRLNELINFKTIFSYDRIFRDKAACVLSITIPFGYAVESSCYCRSSVYYSPPERLDLIILKDKKSCNSNW